MLRFWQHLMPCCVLDHARDLRQGVHDAAQTVRSTTRTIPPSCLDRQPSRTRVPRETRSGASDPCRSRCSAQITKPMPGPMPPRKNQKQIRQLPVDLASLSDALLDEHLLLRRKWHCFPPRSRKHRAKKNWMQACPAATGPPLLYIARCGSTDCRLSARLIGPLGCATKRTFSCIAESAARLALRFRRSMAMAITQCLQAFDDISL